jgi:hypothetical protein
VREVIGSRFYASLSPTNASSVRQKLLATTRYLDSRDEHDPSYVHLRSDSRVTLAFASADNAETLDRGLVFLDIWQFLEGGWSGDRIATGEPITSRDASAHDFGSESWSQLRILACMPDENPASTIGWLSHVLEMRPHETSLLFPMDDDIALSLAEQMPPLGGKRAEATVLIRVCDAWRAWRKLTSTPMPQGWQHDEPNQGIVGSPVGEFFLLRNSCGIRLYVMEWVPELDSPAVRRPPDM